METEVGGSLYLNSLAMTEGSDQDTGQWMNWRPITETTRQDLGKRPCCESSPIPSGSEAKVAHHNHGSA